MIYSCYLNYNNCSTMASSSAFDWMVENIDDGENTLGDGRSSLNGLMSEAPRRLLVTCRGFTFSLDFSESLSLLVNEA